jgi:D-glycero-D-manno-heptose 1,7-bisphosphate phosphatase
VSIRVHSWFLFLFEMKPAALILDRDGTLIEHVPYLCDPAEVRLLPGVREALQTALAAGIRLFLHSNQSGVGRGYFELAAVTACNDRLIELLDLGPQPFARICIAPEAPDQPSDYRKPSPLLAREIMRDFGLQPAAVWYLGDRGSDLATAHAAGTRGIGIATGLDDLRAELAALGLTAEFPVVDSIAAAVQLALGQE